MDKQNTKKKKPRIALRSVTNSIGDAITGIGGKSKDLLDKSQKTIIDTLDQNKDGTIDIEDIIILGFKTPGVHINRSDF